jgi:hypothetical protein
MASLQTRWSTAYAKVMGSKSVMLVTIAKYEPNVFGTLLSLVNL